MVRGGRVAVKAILCDSKTRNSIHKLSKNSKLRHLNYNLRPLCQFEIFTSKHKIHLTFIGLFLTGTDPICSSNFTQSTATGDVIQLSCTIVYGAYRGDVDIDAVITWSVNGQPIPTNNATFTINSSPTEITATSTLVVDRTSVATYECATTFSKPANSPPPEIVATNAPDYFKTCTIWGKTDFLRIYYFC